MMGYFPMCVDLTGRRVILIGSGPQVRDKAEKLRSFGAELVFSDSLEPEVLTADVAFVVAGDQTPADAAAVSALCRARGIPVNVVDDPRDSTFFFPALICRGDLTVSVSTGGTVPAAGAAICRRIGAALPDDTEEILNWLHELRGELYATLPKEQARRILRNAAEQAFAPGRRPEKENG